MSVDDPLKQDCTITCTCTEDTATYMYVYIMALCDNGINFGSES